MALGPVSRYKGFLTIIACIQNSKGHEGFGRTCTKIYVLLRPRRDKTYKWGFRQSETLNKSRQLQRLARKLKLSLY